MDLQHFIVRAEVLSLMRKALRLVSKAPPESKLELRAEIRRCFEASRHVTDASPSSTCLATVTKLKTS